MKNFPNLERLKGSDLLVDGFYELITSCFGDLKTQKIQLLDHELERINNLPGQYRRIYEILNTYFGILYQEKDSYLDPRGVIIYNSPENLEDHLVSDQYIFYANDLDWEKIAEVGAPNNDERDFYNTSTVLLSFNEFDEGCLLYDQDQGGKAFLDWKELPNDPMEFMILSTLTMIFESSGTTQLDELPATSVLIFSSLNFWQEHVEFWGDSNGEIYQVYNDAYLMLKKSEVGERIGVNPFE